MGLIALHGAPGAGKDHFAHTLMESGQWSRIAFAGPLKRGLSAMLNIPMEDIENPNIKNEPDYKFGKSIRYMAQTLGTEWGRQLIADDIWIEMARESIIHQMNHGQNVVITDLRFPNEVKLIRELGGTTIKIIRDNNKHAMMSTSTGVAKHASDVVIPDSDIDYVIYNNHSIEMYEDEIAKVVCSIIMKT